MMWNFLVSGLLTDAAIVLYDGSPGHPDMGVLWDLAERAQVTCFGTSAAYIAACMKAGVEPGDGRDLSRAARRRLDRLAALARGLPLGLRPRRRGDLAVLHQRRHRPLHGVRRRLPDPARLRGRAAGAGARRVGRGVGPRGPAAGRRGRRARGHRADAVDAALPVERPGRRALPRVLLRHVPGRVAPRRLDRDHRARHRDHHRPLRRHDQPRRRADGHGRDLPRGAARRRGGRRAGGRRRATACRCSSSCATAPELDDELVERIRTRVREDCSPRHVPDEVVAVEEVPRTLSGKVLELPVKRILMGTPPEQAASRDSLANPDGAGLLRQLGRGAVSADAAAALCRARRGRRDGHACSA